MRNKRVVFYNIDIFCRQITINLWIFCIAFYRQISVSFTPGTVFFKFLHNILRVTFNRWNKPIHRMYIGFRNINFQVKFRIFRSIVFNITRNIQVPVISIYFCFLYMQYIFIKINKRYCFYITV